MVARTRRSVGVIDLMQAIYDLSVPRVEWLGIVSRAITRDLDAPFGCLTIDHRRRPGGVYEMTPLFIDTPTEVLASFQAVTAPLADPDSHVLASAVRAPFAGLLETFPPGDAYRDLCTTRLASFGARDTNLLTACDTAADLVTMSMFFSRVSTPTRAVRAKYQRVASHLTAALRLRRRLDTQPQNDGVNAIFRSDGRNLDALDDARNRETLDELRTAVRARETALAQLSRNAAGDALRAWTALVAGRWSLLDRFESDGRRFVVAIRNENVPKDPRALTPREEHVAQLAGSGRPNGRIAYALGTSVENVSAHLHSALRKLRCESRRDLIRMMSPKNYEFTLDVNGEIIGVIAEAPAVELEIAAMTEAERRVLMLLRQGKSNAEIARHCGTAMRTVANQVASLLRKSRARSRYELMHRT